MPHIKSLDGVRAIAVLLVVFFHLGVLPFGWIGVQIFFVLSGYLITGILISTKKQDLKGYLARFYWRRSLRIFPLYFGFLVVGSVGFAASFAQDWPWLVTYTANFARLRHDDLTAPFVHLWSLAVEEQFYLLWPLALFSLPIPALRKLVIAVVILAPLSRLALYVTLSDEPANWLGRTIYSLPTSQFDAFAAGAFLAIYPITHVARRFLLAMVAVAGTGMAVLLHQHLAYHSAVKGSLGYAMFLLQDGGFVWGYSLLNIAAALGIAFAIKHSPFWLQSAPIARIGTISYGVYVIHLPLLICFERIGPPRGAMIPLFLCTTYALAEISYRYFETPFLRLKDRHAPEFTTAKR